MAFLRKGSTMVLVGGRDTRPEGVIKAENERAEKKMLEGVEAAMNRDDDRRGWGEATRFLDALEHAGKMGLQHEFVKFFFDDYRIKGDLDQAIWYANCEWDL